MAVVVLAKVWLKSTGHQIRFLITQDEIDKIKRIETNKKILKQQKPPPSKRWVETFEFGETGHIIEFPMNREGVEKEKQWIKKQKDQALCVISVDEYETIEMGNSHMVTFKKN